MKTEKTTRITINDTEKKVIAMAFYNYIIENNNLNLYDSDYVIERSEDVKTAETILNGLGYDELVKLTKEQHKQAAEEKRKQTLKDAGLL